MAVEQEVGVEQEPADHGPNAMDSLAIVQIVLSQMTMLESRLIHKLTENADAAKERWKSHDQQHAEWEDWAKEFSGAIKEFDGRLARLERKDEDEKLVWDARVGPVRRAVLIAAREWRTLLIAAMFVATWIAQQMRLV